MEVEREGQKMQVGVKYWNAWLFLCIVWTWPNTSGRKIAEEIKYPVGYFKSNVVPCQLLPSSNTNVACSKIESMQLRAIAFALYL